MTPEPENLNLIYLRNFEEFFICLNALNVDENDEVVKYFENGDKKEHSTNLTHRKSESYLIDTITQGELPPIFNQGGGRHGFNTELLRKIARASSPEDMLYLKILNDTNSYYAFQTFDQPVSSINSNPIFGFDFKNLSDSVNLDFPVILVWKRRIFDMTKFERIVFYVR